MWLQSAWAALTHVFINPSSFFEDDVDWRVGVSYNAFYAALIQCFVVLFTIGLAYGSGTSVSGAGLSSVTGGVIELLYVFFAILVWGGLVGVSLTVVSDQEWLQPVVLTGSLIGVGAVAIGVASWLGLSTLVRSLVFFGTIGVWTVATYTVLWFDTSWFESVLGVAMYTWLVSYPYLLVNSVVSVLQTFSVLSGLVVNAMSALLSAAAIVHIVTGTVRGVEEQLELSLWRGALAVIVGPIVLILGFFVLLYLSVLV